MNKVADSFLDQSQDEIEVRKNRICKGKCIQFKAIKPSTGGRYESGQYRCQMCEIYLTPQGINGNSCKCCNYRVRSKPRNSLYKEKFNDNVQNTESHLISSDETGHIIKSTKENITSNFKDEKKIYSNI